MKKKYLLFILFFAISFVIGITVKAEEKGTFVMFENISSYDNMSCTGNMYFEIFDNDADSRIARIKSEYKDKAEFSGTDQIVCEWSGRNGDNISGTKTFTFGYETGNGEMTITERLTALVPTSDISRFGTVKEVHISPDSSKITTNCSVGSSTCTFTGINFESDSPYHVEGYVLFDTGSGTKKINLELTLVKSGFVHANDAGQDCGLAAAGWIWQSEYNMYQHTTSTSYTLPACKAKSSSDMIEFAGWVPYEGLDSGNSLLTPDIESCKNMDGFIHGSKTFAAGETSNIGDYYVACFGYKNRIMLYTNRNELVNSSGWTLSNGIYYSDSTSVTLPEVKSDSEYYEFIGWRENGTTNILKAGQSYQLPEGKKVQDFTAIFESVSERAYYYSGRLKINTTESISKIAGTKLNLENCTSTNTDVVTVNFNSGECMVYGSKEGTTTVIGEATVNDKKYTYSVSVTVMKKGTTGPTDGQYGSIVDEDDDPDATPEDSGSILSIGSDLVCKYYTVTKAGDSGGLGNDGYLSRVGSIQMGFNFYQAKTTKECTIDKTYYGLCLDPGQRGPGDPYQGSDGKSYSYSRRLDIVHSKLDAGLYTIAAQISSRGFDLSSAQNKRDYAAADFSGRVLSFVLGDANGNNIVYSEQHTAYKAIANATKSAGGKSIAVPSNFTTYDAEWFNTAQAYYNMAANTTYSQEDVDALDITTEGNEETGTWSSDNSTLTIINSGYITLPEGSTTPKTPVPNCTISSDYTCSVLEFNNVGGNKYYYKFQIDVRLKENTPIPDESNLETLAFKLEFNNNKSLGNGFVITHTTYAQVYQRLILINPGITTYIMYVRWPNACNVKNPALDYTKCTKDGCPGVNALAFSKLKCCDLITDKTSYAYQYLCNGGDCTYSNFLPQCRYEPDGSSSIDLLQINEATDGINKQYKYRCIVAVDRKCGNGGDYCTELQRRQATDLKKDIAGNKFSLDMYKDNEYCRVSCKEDWNFSLNAFKSFTGKFSIPSGSYFRLNDLYVGGSRTCVTTKINYEKYMKIQEEYAKQIVDAWNYHEKYRAVYEKLADAEPGTYCTVSDLTYYPDDGDKTTHCHSGEYDKETGKCTYEDEKYVGELCYNFTVTAPSVSGVRNYHYNGAEFSASFNSGMASTTDNLVNVGDDHEGGGECLNTDPAKVKNGNSSNYDLEQVGFYTPSGHSSTYSPSGSGNGGPTKGTCSTARADVLAQLAGEIDAYKKDVDEITHAFEVSAHEFAMCQNFQQITKSKLFPEEFNDNNPVEKAYIDGTVYTNESTVLDMNVIKYEENATEIETQYSPYGEYDYEEKDYMNLIGKDNYIVPYIKRDEKAFKDVKFTTVENDCAEGEYTFKDRTYSAIIGQDEMGRDIKLCRHYYSTQGYQGKADDSETENDIYGKEPDASSYKKKSLKDETETFGDKDVRLSDGYIVREISLCKTQDGGSYGGYGYQNSRTAEGECGKVTIYYYKVNYIRQILANSSFWVNKGLWYTNEQDEKKYSFNSAALAGNKDFDNTLGGPNVFPVSMRTRRNIYQYVYTFSNIGQYSDNALGRIMGGEVDGEGNAVGNGHQRHVIEDNSHACFYEVYESVCRCCGEPIATTAISYNGQVSTTDYIDNNGDFYKESDYNKIPYDSALGLYTNVVSLSNLASSTKRVLGANWLEATPFILEGEKYTTDQGSELLAQIESKADGIYDKVPEYSFTLSPSVISEIRDYNKDHNYGIPKQTDLVIYGKMGYRKSEAGKWEVPNSEMDERIRFSHYGSKYLELLDKKGYTTQEYMGKLLINKTGNNVVCEVDAGHVADIYNTDSYRDCRWIDYITIDKDGRPIRLAFK